MNMLHVNMPDAEFKPIERGRSYNGIQYWYARFNEKSVDGITYAIECELKYEPTMDDLESLKKEWFTINKKWKISSLIGYANSDTVKSFRFGNAVVNWINSESRVSIRRAIEDKKAEGRKETVIYLSDGGHTLSIEDAEDMFRKLEVYASDCYQVCEEHKKAIELIQTLAELDEYDITTNFPETPSFNY